MTKFKKDDPLILDISSYIENFANENQDYLAEFEGVAIAKMRGMLEIVEYLTGNYAYLIRDGVTHEWSVRIEGWRN